MEPHYERKNVENVYSKKFPNLLDKLQDLVKEYNRTYHSSIKMTPVEASRKKNQKKVFKALYGDFSLPKRKRAKFSVGDKVRISRLNQTFEKGYESNWTEEVFVVEKVLNTFPVT